MKIHGIATTLLLLLFWISGNSQINESPPFQEPGKCYAKCYIGDVYEEYEESLPVYIGENEPENDPNLDKVELIVDQGRRWIEKKDSYGRTTYCLIEEKSEKTTEELIIVKDTSQTKDFVIEYFAKKRLIKKGGVEWREVVCGKKVKPELIVKIQEKLIEQGFDDLIPNGKMDKQTKGMLVDYQKRNGLPVGNLDVETMDNLGVNY